MERGRRLILVVEDEESIAAPLASALEREGFDAKVAGTLAEGVELTEKLAPDLVLLDLMLPDGSGLDLVREVRMRSRVPIIVLSARGDEADRIVGLEVGADDYVVKPFSAREVAARIRSVLRRSVAPDVGEPSSEIAAGDLRLDLAQRKLTKADTAVDLSRKEFDLLAVLMQRAGTVVTREQLIDEVWDVNWFGPTKTLDVHVSSLRKKLGDDPADPRYLHTVRGVGFRFSSPAELAET